MITIQSFSFQKVNYFCTASRIALSSFISVLHPHPYSIHPTTFHPDNLIMEILLPDN